MKNITVEMLRKRREEAHAAIAKADQGIANLTLQKQRMEGMVMVLDDMIAIEEHDAPAA